jgi:hypothetical protein
LVLVFDMNAPYELPQVLEAPDAFVKKFGQTVSLFGNTAVVASPVDSTQASGAGALYVIRNIQRRMPLTKRTRKGDLAPGAVDINFVAIGDSFISPSSQIAFTSTLGGLGSGAGKDNGGWTSPGNNLTLDLILKTRQLDAALKIGVVSKPLFNRPDAAIFQATLTGPLTIRRSTPTTA